MKRRNNAAGHGVLPLDVLFDVLVRLPAKEICRFRAVCRPWRCLTSDPVFIQEHAARHRSPLIVASFHDDDKHVHLMDLSGRILKTLPVPAGLTSLCSRLDLICVASLIGNISLINPATGTVKHLPNAPAEHFDSHDSSSDEEWGLLHPEPEIDVFALGRVDSTGEYKVLRVSSVPTPTTWFDDREDLPCHGTGVLTVNGSARRTRWISHMSPDEFLLDLEYMDDAVVVGGSVYFLWHTGMFPMRRDEEDMRCGISPHYIAVFNLDKEQWRSIPGPRHGEYYDHGSFDDDEDVSKYFDMWTGSTLAELNGCLVLVHKRDPQDSSTFLDLWFLTDAKKHVWAKQYTILAPEAIIPATERVKPLLLLHDGRIVIFLGSKGVLLVYDPATNLFPEMDTRRLDAVVSTYITLSTRSFPYAPRRQHLDLRSHLLGARRIIQARAACLKVQQPSTPVALRRRPVMVNHLAAASRHGRVMPPDVLFDILLRLPAKDCRLPALAIPDL
ncbi:hypothetical protein PR202_gb03320 [Eleusine coracana subsp. coracana]|uniref:F-box domain-containing protein n=1 Tax=Eleusine coracana subsp. coracana TaxID=191504 RepID=A0AAV5E0W3_ELECO|nr:hypothetical protein PR202_gb03240 [Eleusine coracana subsp. coracana]GJN16342.1 hypothetical protein PR202_gb03320 [Eleusine coracana subsp. coracana]